METKPFALIAALCLGAAAALAQEPRPDEPAKTEPAKSEARKEDAKAVPPPVSFVTRHSGRYGTEAVAYTASASEIHLRDDKGEPKAAIFTFAYVKDGVKDAATRPVTFVWNGGPGSSSIWLHMGAIGPRRVVVPSDAQDDGPPPYQFEDNAASPLDATDLVFVDPVGTGWSRALGKHESKEFWGLHEDADSVTELIRAWVTENRRWASPKYLLGESFGTTRAAAVAGRMEGEAAMSLNGVILVSQALDYQGSTPEHDNLISYVTYLPTMAATAWYHGKVADRPADLRAFLTEARAFAVDEYAPALFKGNGLDPAARARLRARLARFTGLSETYLEQAELRPLAGRFLKELLRGEGKTVGRLDGRYLGEDVDRVAEQPDGDPGSAGISSAYAAGLNVYVAEALGVKMDRPYAVSGGPELGRNWKWRPTPEGSPWEPSYVNTSRDLSRALRKNRGLRVMVASGYYDFATPFFDAEYTFASRGFLKERLTFTYYEAGHMMYLHHPSLAQFAADVRTFIRGGR
jgi:carboxypeptidase C (cathepsin A)